VTDSQHAECLAEYAGLAMQCSYMDRRTLAIGRVRNVEAFVDAASNRIEVNWQAPVKNVKLVNHYAVYYRDVTSNRTQLVRRALSDRPTQYTLQAKTRSTHLVLDKVTAGRTYEVYVVAVGLNSYSPFTRATDLAHTYHEAGTVPCMAVLL